MIKRQDLEKIEVQSLAPYAMKSGESKGRQHKEKEHSYRTRFQRDRDRIIHTAAFRRLEYKTQVFVYHEGDYYRTRLTHSLEVAQIARSICKSLQLNEDLAEAVALSHDLGHPPFGHTGQNVLNRLMKGNGGFEHNKQSLRIVKLLEKRYPEFDGLNLTWEVMEGISKHSQDEDNPVTSDSAVRFPSLEAQVADFADSIAYNAHDLDDGITSNLLDLGQLRKVALWKENEKKFDEKYTGLDFKLKKYQVVRSIINDLISDFRRATLKNLKQYKVGTVDDVRRAPVRMAAFGKEVADLVEGVTVDKTVDEVTGLTSLIVREPKQRSSSAKDMRPMVRLTDANGSDVFIPGTDIPAMYFLPGGAIVRVSDGQEVEIGDIDNRSQDHRHHTAYCLLQDGHVLL